MAVYEFESRRVPGHVIRVDSEAAAVKFRRRGFVEIVPEPEYDEPDDD